MVIRTWRTITKHHSMRILSQQRILMIWVIGPWPRMWYIFAMSMALRKLIHWLDTRLVEKWHSKSWQYEFILVVLVMRHSKRGWHLAAHNRQYDLLHCFFSHIHNWYSLSFWNQNKGRGIIRTIPCQRIGCTGYSTGTIYVKGPTLGGCGRYYTHIVECENVVESEWGRTTVTLLDTGSQSTGLLSDQRRLEYGTLEDTLASHCQSIGTIGVVWSHHHHNVDHGSAKVAVYGGCLFHQRWTKQICTIVPFIGHTRLFPESYAHDH